MFNNFNHVCLTIVLFFTIGAVKAQTTFYDVPTIQQIEVNFSQPNWDYQLDTAKSGSDGYIVADWVKINGVQFDSAGVKYKGNSSYDPTYSKNPIHIELDHVLNQAYQGITDIKLGNGYADPSMIREVLAYGILSNYMDCPKSNFAQLYINGTYIGLYSNDESIGKYFCSNHFYSDANTFFKCNPIVTPGPTTKSNLKYIPLADSSAYFNYYELKSTTGWNELVQLCDTVTNNVPGIESMMDMDRVMWMLAFNSVLVNLDSYTGVFCQNYYLYKDLTNRFNPIVWDLNMAFGGFPYVGSGNSSLAGLTVANMQQLPLTFHSTDPYWPLINAVMNNATYKKQYLAHARTLTNENFTNGNYVTIAQQLQAIVDTAVNSDTNKFYSYSQFQNAITTDYPVGSYTVPGISNLMNSRVSYFQSNSDFLLVPPIISGINVSNSSPILNSLVDITAMVTNVNANQVHFGYRQNLQDKFIRVPMYDDGIHNDGAAGDNVYGVSISINSLLTQYYIYAENNDAGIFSPERSEHEFYSLYTLSSTPSAGQVTINEFLASNSNDQVNEYGNYADWIELYNNTSSPLSLFGLYLTDDFNNPLKFPFPQNTIISPNGYLIVWADQELTTASYIHANFKLSATGEYIMLSNGGAAIIDSLSFGPQNTDVSSGRCPNGTGPFVTLPYTSFSTLNCTQISVQENINEQEIISIYPNPTTDYFTYSGIDKSQLKQIIISNSMGQRVISTVGPIEDKVNISKLTEGIYFITFISTASEEREVKLVKSGEK